MTYGRVVIYSHSEDRDELETKAREGVLPIVKAADGFLAYGVLVTEDRVVSSSAWASEAQAKAIDDTIKAWVKDNTTMVIEGRYDGELAWLEVAGG